MARRTGRCVASGLFTFSPKVNRSRVMTFFDFNFRPMRLYIRSRFNFPWTMRYPANCPEYGLVGVKSMSLTVIFKSFVPVPPNGLMVPLMTTGPTPSTLALKSMSAC